ncbi:Protein serine/threonine kinase [Entamoeba marina]
MLFITFILLFVFNVYAGNDEGCSCTNKYFGLCTHCNTGCYLNSNDCKNCDSYCADCNALTHAVGKCTDCNDGYFLNVGSCILCSSAMDGCTNCESSSTCTSCDSGYYLSNGKCIKCSDTFGYVCSSCSSSTCENVVDLIWTGCTSCTDGECSDCESNYYYLSDGKCIGCEENCKTCSSSGCSECESGYYLEDTQCISCSTRNCGLCDVNSCSNCIDDNAFLVNGECKTCSEAKSNCKTCSGTFESPICDLCSIGYYPDSSGDCVSCNSDCGDEGCVPTNGYCVNCADSTKVLVDGDCLSLEDAHCSNISDNICIECKSGYELILNECREIVTCTIGTTKLSDGSCVNDENCNSYSGTTCTTCEDGYSINSDGICATCEDEIKHCSYCIESTSGSEVCGICRNGYYPSKTCHLCSTITGCISCESSVPDGDDSIIECTECDNGYYLDNKRCTEIENCQQSTGTQCTLCDDNYILSNGECIYYTQQNGCTSASSNYCTSCSSSYYLDQSTSICEYCSISLCSTCNTTGYCVECSDGYTLISSITCGECTFTGCSECYTTINKCQTCNDYYYMLNEECTICNNKYPNCSKCNETTCSECKSGYYLDSNTCHLCSEIEGCSLCSTSKTCTQCSDGYYLTNGICKLCSNDINNCDSCSSIITCTYCSSGYYLESNTCKVCSTISGCEYCYGDRKECIYCQDYYQNITNSDGELECKSCTELDSNCKSCDVNGYCIECKSIYTLNNNGECVLCTSSFGNCSTCSQTSYECTNCINDGYIINGDKCQSCLSLTDDKCTSCTSSTKCTGCSDGYYLNNSECIDCTTISNCEECNSITGECTLCSNDYYPLNNGCDSCSNFDNCNTCSQTSNECTECDNGFIIDDGECTNCSIKYSNCKECDVTNKCTNCSNGYYPVNGLCVECSTITDCLECKSDTKQCTLCNDNNGLNEGKCTNCTVEYCDGCSENSSICTTCEYGYYLNNTVCLQCTTIIGCLTCNQQIEECTECDYDNGYYLDGSICSLCNSDDRNCNKCTDTTTCDECLTGYVLNGNTCSSCNIEINNCEECSNDSENIKCTKCSSRYIVDSGDCIEIKSYEYKTSDTTTKNCSNTLTYCYSCDYSTNETLNNYDTSGLKCNLCKSPYSFTSDDSETCSYCSSAIMSGVCVGCSTNCESCINSTYCIDCSNGYILRNGECNNYDNSDYCISYTKQNIGCEECINSITTQGICSNLSRSNDCSYYYVTSNKEDCIDYYQSITSKSTSIDNCEEEKDGRCVECSFGYYLDGSSIPPQCSKCNTTCSECNFENICISCNSNTTIDLNGDCLTIDNCLTTTNNTCLKCNNGYYVDNGECKNCLIGCEQCYNDDENEYCLKCSNDYILINSECISFELSNCSIRSKITTKCIQCNDGYELTSNNLCELIEIDNCKYTNNSICRECYDEFDLGKNTNGNIICNETITIKNCLRTSNKGCLRCKDGYYEMNGLCYQCNSNCKTCSLTSTQCIKCQFGYKLNEDNTCSSLGELTDKCDTFFPDGDGCAICKEGYYWKEKNCYECDVQCSTCTTNSSKCLACNTTAGYFVVPELSDYDKCVSIDTLTHCLLTGDSGCLTCEDEYYLDGYDCSECNDECTLCESENGCTSCQNDYVLITTSSTGECKHYSEIERCTEAEDNKCTKCDGSYSVSTDGTECIYHANIGLMVGLPISLLFIIIICLIIIIVVIVFYIRKHKQQHEKERTICEFDIGRSNIQFHILNEKCGLISNRNDIDFLIDKEIDDILLPVNEESRDLICIGNKKSKMLKVQFSVKDDCDKYEIRTNPQIITLKKGKACEFEIYIKPLCTCSIDEHIMLIALDMNKGIQYDIEIPIKMKTEITSHLDYSELIEEKKIGEGSFGIVYKGTFRGNQVAIKKMKEVQDDDDVIKEFNKEVSMLDKFRSDYIVHFYGAVMIPHKICMVTEFAQYGSLQDLMNKQNQPRLITKVKILLNCSKGIEYLHINGILHRDIKPANFLIFSIDDNVEVNAKLTDFGSSRNINMLTTNMTFTKGIGTPAYMAPEVLKQNKYKKAADIYSFGVTMYEIMIWNEVYPKDKFKFPWKIAEFVTNGERLPKPNDMNDSIYSLISNCWKHEAKERYSIEEVIDNLNSFN